ncbi:MAG TPA: hypothetical protein VIG29_12820, partial [Vicinamibacteria bacterium]
MSGALILRSALAAAGAGAVAPLILALALRFSPSIDLSFGPGDRDYVQGFSEKFRFDGERTSRRLVRRGRVALPLGSRGGGVLVIDARAPEGPSLLELRFDEGTAASVTVPPSKEFRSL